MITYPQNFNVDSDMTPLQVFDLIYVASPYTKYPWGIEAAYDDIARITGHLLGHNLSVYSPIVHTHKIAMAANIDPVDHTFWMKFDTAMMRKSDAILVVKMSGWEESRGVKHEIDFFNIDRKPMFTYDPGFVR